MVGYTDSWRDPVHAGKRWKVGAWGNQGPRAATKTLLPHSICYVERIVLSLGAPPATFPGRVAGDYGELRSAWGAHGE